MTASSRIQEKVAGHLARLEQADLVRSGGLRELEFRFKHSLIQEATYASLVRDQRRAFHREVADAILELHPEVSEQQPAILARHYVQAGEDEPAFQFAVRAGNLARLNHAYEEAIANYDIALQVIERLPVGPHSPQIREAFLGKGIALEFGGRHAEAKETFGRLRDFAVRVADPSLEAEALNRLATAAVVGAEDIDAQELLDRALDRSRRAGDPLLVARALWNQGLLYRFSDPLRADSYFHQALDIVRTPIDPALPADSGAREIEGYILIDLMVSHMTSGRRREGLSHGRHALAVFRLLDHQPMIADALTGTALLDYFGGDLDKALEQADEASRISTRIENPWGRTYSGWVSLGVLADRGEYSRALRLAEDTLRAAQRVPFLGFRAAVHGILVTVHLELGQVEAAMAQAKRLAAVFDGATQRDEGWKAWTSGIRARAFLAVGDLRAAEILFEPYRSLPEGVIPQFQGYYILGPAIACLDVMRGEVDRGLAFADRLIGLFRDETADRYEAEMLYWRARLHAEKASWAAAEADVRRALERIDRAGARALQWPMHAHLATILSELGDPRRAAESRRAAAGFLRAIADDIEDGAQRASFLARTDVASLLQ